MKKIFIILGIVVIIIVLVLCLSFKIKNNEKIIDNNSIISLEDDNDYKSDEDKVEEDWQSDNNIDANKVYSINEKSSYLYKDNLYGRTEDYRGFKLLEYDIYDDYDEVYYVLYDYTTDPTYYYYLTVEDENKNNIILKQNEQQIIGGVISRVRINKQDLTSKITFSVIEKNTYTEKIENDTFTELDLSNDLEDYKKIDETSSIEEGRLGNIIFEYTNSENVYYGTLEHAYSKKYIGENYSIPVKVQYGNYLATEEHIDFISEKNVNNLTLEQAYESLKLINENFGQFGLSDIYGLTLKDTEYEEVLVTFDEMIALCRGEKILKDNVAYTKESFQSFTEMQMVKEENLKIGNDISSIKYRFEGNGKETNYMFLDDDNLYYIRVPNNKRIKNSIDTFLDSVKITN